MRMSLKYNFFNSADECLQFVHHYKFFFWCSYSTESPPCVLEILRFYRGTAISLNEPFFQTALHGVDSEIGDNVSANTNAAAFRLVMSANYLLTLEKITTAKRLMT